MELTHDFRVPVPIAKAWTLLTDLERIAPCMPGAQLQEVEGDEFRGIVKVKVGPITAQYKGTARLVERDDADHRAVLRAEGRDTRGQGNASATITAVLSAQGPESTEVRITTDLTVTGKVANFGRNVMADVSNRLLDQFVENLERDVLSGIPDGSGPGSSMAAGSGSTKTVVDQGVAPAPRGDDAIRVIDAPEAVPVDLLDAAGVPMAKRAIPIVAGVLVIVWFLRRRRRRG
ncbi:MAG TPA: SRPBCC family protein [Acidimicrobiales bacterium]|nr:SRPBCC family protein [Acidimicrobiales bacterium]